MPGEYRLSFERPIYDLEARIEKLQKIKTPEAERDVRLMRREGDEWVEQAVEKIDSPDIEHRLERLIAPIENGGPVMLFLPQVICRASPSTSTVSSWPRSESTVPAAARTSGK